MESNTKFHNPYHFVPVDTEIPESITITPEQPLSAEALGHRTFDRYHETALSGRLVCRLNTMGPVVIGAGQEEADGGHTRVHPFERDGKPAVPASTLRGSISAIAEAATNSALRVLDNSYYSMRVPINDKRPEDSSDFSALGVIVKGRDGELKLIPLAMPTLKKEDGEGYFTLPPKYRKMFPYLPEVKKEYRFKAFCYEDDCDSAPDSYCHENRKHLYAMLDGNYAMDSEYRIRGTGGKLLDSEFLLGLETTDDPIEEQEWKRKRPMRPERGGAEATADSEEERPENGDPYVRGRLRVLSSPGRRRDIPQKKKYEIFVPYPEPADGRQPRSFPIDSEALERFYRIASARETENKRRESELPNRRQDFLPYALKGATPFRHRPEPYRLRPSDIVFFTPDEEGERVVEVRVSQIWREELPQPAHEFFRNVNPELLPFNRTRRTITPAEALFGFVEMNEDSQSEGERTRQGTKRERKSIERALASRVRFSEGRLVHGPDDDFFHPEITLRILGSPKPPCPSLYFRGKDLPDNPDSAQCFISKRDLREHSTELFEPQGRKFYLNHPVDSVLQNCQTSNPGSSPKQKNKVRPVKEGCEFLFHIDFENLSPWELGLLVYSVEPAPEFHHKIGMGKALGLGTVKMEVTGIFYVDRLRRYSVEGFLGARKKISPRYHACWVRGDLPSNAPKTVGTHEMAALDGQRLPNDHDHAPEKLRTQFAAKMKERVRRALGKIGRPNQERVMPPLRTDQKHDPEDQTFRWFQQNERRKAPKNQGLIPLEYGDDIPELEHN